LQSARVIGFLAQSASILRFRLTWLLELVRKAKSTAVVRCVWIAFHTYRLFDIDVVRSICPDFPFPLSLSNPSHVYRLRLPPKPVDSYLAPPLDDGGEADDPPPPPPKDGREGPAPLLLLLLLFPNQFDGPACPVLGPRLLLLLRLPKAYPAAAPAAAPLNNPGRQDEELGAEREFCFEYGE
jgi:hypothetical protein